MNYETLSWETKAITPKENGSADFQVGIITGIVGNTYPQFIAGDTTTINIPSYGTKTGADINMELSAAVHAYVAAKYPNT
jgi:hypothetical protein